MKSRVAFTLPALLIAALAVGFSFLPTSPTSHTPLNTELKAVVSSTTRVAKVVPVDTTKKGAAIKIEQDTYDFHDIEQGTKAVHDFEIGNSGTDTLVISGTRPSCGCTAAVMGTSRIPPGGTSMLHVTFDANNKPEGPIIKTVTITSNATNGSDRIVKIQGRVVKSKLAHKTMMHLDGVFQGDCAKCHVDKGKGELGARLYEADCAV
ncbi:MAG TPA: DUF1573 domain-containing protein, partial [Candidatus Kapabacteria bacterium]|nr:DUF1573 domain-containing protein [Candidatus Kapabacteria bacterium]